MKGFDIDKVELMEDEPNSPTPEKLLTGDVIKGLDPHSPIEPNAELEDGEYLQFPDGTTQKVVGEDHEDGGTKMNIPDGTKVISNSLTFTPKQVKALNKEFDLKLSVKDTYAIALDKYTKKIGLQKLNDEQEELFKELKKVVETKSSPGTDRVNKEFLDGKILSIEKRKTDKEKVRANFFNKVFDMQESVKPKKLTKEEGFKYGGLSEQNFKMLCEKHGLTREDGEALLNGEDLVKFAKGGEKGTTDGGGTFKVRAESNSFSTQERIKQSATKKGYGKVTEDNIENTLKELYRNFPDIVAQSDVFDIKIDDKGNFSYNSNINFSTQSKEVAKFQQEAKRRMEATADVVLKNPDKFDPTSVESAQKFKSNEIFTDGADLVTGIDQKYGNFTSGRFNLGLDVVTPAELEQLTKSGITTVEQLNSAVNSKKVDISPESVKRLTDIYELQKGTGADFIIDAIKPSGADDSTPGISLSTTAPVDPTADIQDNVSVPRTKGPRQFYMPDQSTLPPSPLETGTMVTNRFGRIDPIRVGVEPQLDEISRQRQAITSQLDGLPSTARAAALASLLSTATKATNQTITDANKINAQNMSSAELFNIGQSDRENIAAGNNALNYEARAMTAEAKTQEELRRYFDYNKKVALNNWTNQQRLNLMSSLFPDYSLNYTGTAVEFDPQSEFQLENRSDYLSLFKQQY